MHVPYSGRKAVLDQSYFLSTLLGEWIWNLIVFISFFLSIMLQTEVAMESSLAWQRIPISAALYNEPLAAYHGWYKDVALQTSNKDNCIWNIVIIKHPATESSRSRYTFIDLPSWLSL